MLSKAVIYSKSYVLYVLLMLVTAAMLLLWVAQIRINDFQAYHESTARNTVTNVAVEAARFVAEKKRLVKLFSRQKAALIREFIQASNDEQLYNQLEQQISIYFPNYFAFTVADASGVAYFEDFDGFVGSYCKDDIEHFALTNNYFPRIHPNPEAYHFDIMVSFGAGENTGILFISFHADILSSLLKSSQALGHQLMLTYPELNSLIEVTADGARNRLDRPNYQLTPEEQQRILFRKPVAGTVWEATDLYTPNLFYQYKNNILVQTIIIFSVFAVVGMFTIAIVRKEERRREKIESDLVIAKELADIANNAKSKFLANMSHELRTPLNAIIGYSEMLEDEANDVGLTELTPDLGRIRRSGVNLLTLINEILDLSKIEAEKMELYVSNFELDALINDVSASVRQLVENNNNELTIESDGRLGFMRSDSLKVQQILFNLISNASKFTKDGTILLKINKETIDSSNFVKIRVQDNGIGMTGDQINRIFQPFSQADSSTTRKYGGTGLGLVITQKFCAMLGGEISVTSEPGEGTIFTVWLKESLDNKIIVADESVDEAMSLDLKQDQFKNRTEEKVDYNDLDDNERYKIAK